MKEQDYGYFASRLFNGIKTRKPLKCLFELTYRCNLDCVHCYCKGSQDTGAELKTEEIKNILDQIYQEGGFKICFTGGEPLLREDFKDIYLYAKNKGFLIEIFTNGSLINEEIIDFFRKYTPFSIEITLNGITKQTYESVTQVKGSFDKVMAAINRLAQLNLTVFIKSNCLKQNKSEIAQVKAFTKRLFGEKSRRFRFDPLILPRLNGDRTPCDYRLSSDEFKEVMRSDDEIFAEYEAALCSNNNLERDKDFLYQCSAWFGNFFINPYGRLKFCQLSEKFSVDLKTTSLKEGFYDVIPQLSNEKFKTNSKCRNCDLRVVCAVCPARAFLETGDEEAPIEYYCELAKETARQIKEHQPSNSKI